MSFTIDRIEAARRLRVSSRTIDRYISAGRIATRRIGKKIFLEEDDVERIRNEDSSLHAYEVLSDNTSSSGDQIKYEHELVHRDREVVNPQSARPDFAVLYREAQDIIARKDAIIQDLSYRLGRSETELAHSIPMVEYKKATFLLESAKSKADGDVVTLRSKIEGLEREILKKNSAILGLAILFILVLAFSVVFFLYTTQMATR